MDTLSSHCHYQINAHSTKDEEFPVCRFIFCQAYDISESKLDKILKQIKQVFYLSHLRFEFLSIKFPERLSLGGSIFRQ